MDGIINVYKEPGFTSHDVVAKLRGILHMKKIGHTGTLDPDAQGVLPVCLGKATKLCGMITDLMKNHPYYTQQLSQQVWFRTATVASAEVVDEAFSDIIGQLSLLFANIIDTLTPRQINFLLAVADGVTNFSSKEVLIKYQLGHLLISKI